ncbi:hypothetical protein RhiirB3_448094 [Rhizophagus irregularis]|uniref:Uncharacterized protein n=1 Tax=Rhizophagus irregularis TaxID=588596 RepID=A0A2I1F8W9_9GLOM|nr:hypothetical protein RhiirC2_772218 [Rhizophagus irregularis]PKY30817.1 hypothetical protein RhiirB3_448094 [Rhizophagus irregularis]
MAKKNCTNGKYLTDPSKWICSCPTYIQNQLNSVEKVDAIFFKKNGNYPLISTYEDTEEDKYIIESDDEQQLYETDLTYLIK